MGLPIVRLNDTSDHGGYIATASDNTFSDGIAVARDHDLHFCPIEGHGTTPVTATSTTVYVNSRAILRVGDKAACGATITQGSPTVNAG